MSTLAMPRPAILILTQVNGGPEGFEGFSFGTPQRGKRKIFGLL
jgi:hypothetical protein